MRVVFGIILALGGIWLMWLVVTGLPFPWEQNRSSGSSSATTAKANTNVQAATVAPAGAGVLGVVGAGVQIQTGGLL
jgi:hypothetical protein